MDRKYMVVVIENDGTIRASELPDDTTATYDRVRDSIVKLDGFRSKIVTVEQWETMVTDLAYQAGLKGLNTMGVLKQ